MTAQIIKGYFPAQVESNYISKDWLVNKIRQAQKASRMYLDGIRASTYDEVDASHEHGYLSALDIVEFWINDLGRR